MKRKYKRRKEITSWSYSAFKQWSECPAKYRYARIDRLPQEQHPAVERGNKIHLLAEYYVRGEIQGMPKELRNFSKHLRTVREAGFTTEEEWALTRSYERTGWKSKDAWWRGKLDLHLYNEDLAHLDIIDHKTGRIYDNHAGQADLYAAMGAHVYEVESCHVEFWYIDQNEVRTYDYDWPEIERLQDQWHERAMAMMQEKEFAPRPTKRGCQWCRFRSDKLLANGKPGPCDLWRTV